VIEPTEQPVHRLPPERFREVLGERYDAVADAIVRAPKVFRGRVIWHVNSTARGGGVVELLQSLLAYARGAGVDARWMVIGGTGGFFGITKRIHNRLHGAKGDGGPLGTDERAIYEAVLEANARRLARVVRPGDIVFLHDPQTAGLVEPVRRAGASVVWRCHIGVDTPNDLAREAWDWLRPYVLPADAYVFSREAFVWDGLDGERTWIVPPSIDAFSPKNQAMSPATARAILAAAGLGGDGEGPRPPPLFTRQDGSEARVDRAAALDADAALDWSHPVITQVSRWDRLKDPGGVLRAFAEHVEEGDAQLLLAGPSVEAVADDPEGAQVLSEVRAVRSALPDPMRRRTHLACLPMDDPQENAAIVNAIQRSSAIVIQKSLAEGFGLTVVEAMWKARPVVASRLGGIQDQIVDGESGVLLDDPSDLARAGAALNELLGNAPLRDRIGTRARQRVEDHFLGTRHLVQYLELLSDLADGRT
jgi:trehalose synthase